MNSGATGTLGMLVSYAGQQYILGCNHTLSANGRVLMDPDAKIVSAVLVGDEPPIADPDPHYVPIRDGDNLADCALARINGYTRVSAAFPQHSSILSLPPKIRSPGCGSGNLVHPP